MRRAMLFHGLQPAAWDSRGSRKSTPYAAQMAAETATKAALVHGLKTVEVFVKGPGSRKRSGYPRALHQDCRSSVLKTARRYRITDAVRQNAEV